MDPGTSRNGKCRFSACLRSAVLFCVLPTLAVSCREPARRYDFVRFDPGHPWEKHQHVQLEVDLPDSTESVTLYFALRLRETPELHRIVRYPFTLVFTSPGGTVYRDTVSLPAHPADSRLGAYAARHGLREIEWPYRQGIRSREPGRWQVALLQGDPALSYGNIRGIGISCKAEK